MMITRQELETRFTYHPPQGDQRERYERLRAEFHALAKLIVSLTPESREQSLALTALQEASMWTNAGIACREPQEG